MIGIYLAVGQLQIWLAVARGQKAEPATVFGGGVRPFGRLLGVKILGSLAVVLGILCFLVPGIILFYGFLLAPYFAIDAGLGSVNALSICRAKMHGQKAALFGFEFVSGLLLIGGVIAFGVGIFVALPVIAIGHALIYLRITGQDDEAGLSGLGYGRSAPYGAPGDGAVRP